MVYNLLNGPYINEEGRRIVFVGESNTNRKCMSYARYLMSEHLGRELADDETVDHIDDDKLNDCIENYQILTRIENAQKANSKNPAKIYKGNCPICGATITKFLRVVTQNRKQGKAGPFCSKQCAGKYRPCGGIWQTH